MQQTFGLKLRLGQIIPRNDAKRNGGQFRPRGVGLVVWKLIHHLALKGHGFSRAIEFANKTGALAPEGRSSRKA
ncbi:MAG TPA: hypothetical protein VJX73_17300 [Terracidiphilus sp.]|nr:hypothetical protein [Terracidiphilus sp.]